MAALLSYRAIFRKHAVPLGVSVSTAVWALSQQPRLRLDAAPPTQPRHLPDERGEWLNPQVIKELSSGSLAGFCLGVFVSVFSRTLVLLIGLAVIAIQVAARYGIDMVEQLRLKNRIASSRILSSLNENAAFKLSFGTTFAMSAFMHF